MIAAEGGPVSSALLKDRYTLIEQSIVQLHGDAAPHNTRFTESLLHQQHLH